MSSWRRIFGPARGAVNLLRREGIRAGMLELQTIWPLPERAIRELASRTRLLLVPELNLGQLVIAIRAAVEGAAPVVPLNRIDGLVFTPEEIADSVRRSLALGDAAASLSLAEAHHASEG